MRDVAEARHVPMRFWCKCWQAAGRKLGSTTHPDLPPSMAKALRYRAAKFRCPTGQQ
ncbi:dephospho-CoA kinase/protein folding accessory domain-containing protein [Anopheles sinensis]|uniref:Dephospho-CoA kinase/protein folding accessory domain-containing protein n=1 Tax=Anopheles sinensis TaxID=74873 RepID=A0A084WJ73_ANOSI|nr:dephospho-CoA kinase/protein folding accessory domain-containing protein [Anopheles sinensis]